uniref:ANK_REP_REGION domain-containing protein n=1 Tax=Macrostomum lignano TaxID=282301 RepID=A0A1I8J928_9PLAT
GDLSAHLSRRSSSRCSSRSSRETAASSVSGGQDFLGRSFLHVASFLGNAEAARLLVEASANVNLAAADGSTPLHCAVLGSSERLTRLLAAASRSESSCPDGDGPTCAATDSRQEPPPVSGAAVPLPTSLFLCVLLGRAGVVDVLTGNVEIVRILLRAAADPDRRNSNRPRGSTPLHEAAQFGNIDVMSQLISAGVNTEITDEEGFTPVHRAAESNLSTEAAAVLTKARANSRAGCHAAQSWSQGRTAELQWPNSPGIGCLYEKLRRSSGELIRAGASADMSSDNNEDLVKQAIERR